MGFLQELIARMQGKKELSLEKLFKQPNNRDSVNKILLNRFGSPAIAAGIAGNIDIETGGSFDFRQKQEGGSGEGLFQFTTDKMKSDYRKFLKKNEFKDGPEAQIDFVKSAIHSGKDHEIGWRARGELQKAFATDNPLIISEAFMTHFEKPGVPHSERRLKSSQEHFKQFTGE